MGSGRLFQCNHHKRKTQEVRPEASYFMNCMLLIWTRSPVVSRQK
jgi:hypothetical protein